jgi:GNAT superfamily N-acetyltransferase
LTSLVRVREATTYDWPAVSALLAELGRPDVRGADDEPEHAERFSAYLERDDALALVAETDGRVVGFVDVEFRQRLNFATPQAWIPDLVVSEDARGTGAGALLEEAERHARERGCWGMGLESANWRERSHAFYEHVGWADTGKAFTRPLQEGLVWPPAPR